MTFEEWFETYEFRDNPEAEQHCRDAWNAANDSEPVTPYFDSRIEEMNRREREGK